MKFSWDTDKEKLNRRKHGVTFFEACHVFADRNILTAYDEEHSMSEDRWVSIGQISDGKILVVVHTYAVTRKKEFVRIISARKATEKERLEYLSRRN